MLTRKKISEKKNIVAFAYRYDENMLQTWCFSYIS